MRGIVGGVGDDQVGRPLRIQYDAPARGEVLHRCRIGVRYAAAIVLRVPSGEGVARPGEGTGRERGRRAVGHLLGGHGTSAAVGVELDRVGIGGESCHERRGDVAVARPGGGLLHVVLGELGIGGHDDRRTVERPAGETVATLRGGGDGAGRVLRAHAARQLVHSTGDCALRGVGRVV